MKKIIKSVLAVVMILNLGIPAFAAESVGKNGSQNIDVTAKYSGAVTSPEVYSVDIAWDSMIFTYTETGTMVWNPDTHTYEENLTASWDKESADLIVTNHSNVEVNVTFDYLPVEAYGITTSLSNAGVAVELAAGVEGDVEGAASTTATLHISGTPNDTVTSDGVVVGTITVKIA